MSRTLTIAASLALALAASQALAADAPAKAKAPAKAQAKAAPKVEAEKPLSQGQLDVAPYVFTGAVHCDGDQNVQVSAVDGKPGHFKLAFGAKSYDLTPEETTTGAVRLEDRKAGVVWLQIPSKSMLMDAKAGRRLLDGCLAAQQKA